MSQQRDAVRASRRRDRTTLPCLAMILSCFLLAMGYSSKNALLTWILPAFLVAGSLLYVFLPRRGERGGGVPEREPGSSPLP
jgi:hypothetical protein